MNIHLNDGGVREGIRQLYENKMHLLVTHVQHWGYDRGVSWLPKPCNTVALHTEKGLCLLLVCHRVKHQTEINNKTLLRAFPGKTSNTLQSPHKQLISVVGRTNMSIKRFKDGFWKISG